MVWHPEVLEAAVVAHLQVAHLEVALAVEAPLSRRVSTDVENKEEPNSASSRADSLSGGPSSHPIVQALVLMCARLEQKRI